MARITTSQVTINYLGAVEIKGTIECLTGLHIGSSDDAVKIGGISKFVIRDPVTEEPYIPGSSLKGRMRALLEKFYSLQANRNSGEGIYRHECTDINDALQCPVCSLFGSTTQESNKMNLPARLTVRDCPVIGNYKEPGGFDFEKKSENTLDRLSAHANPRTNERVAKGTKFNFSLKYDVEFASNGECLLLGTHGDDSMEVFWDFIESDLNNILHALRLIEYAYLGGNGTRGYGQVAFDIQTDDFAAKNASELVGIRLNLPLTATVESADLGDATTEHAPDEDTAHEHEVIEELMDDRYKPLRDKIPTIVAQFQTYYEHVFQDAVEAAEEELTEDATDQPGEDQP